MTQTKENILKKLLMDSKQELNTFLDTFSKHVIQGEASLFLGAGMSRNSGFPSWKELFSSCAKELDLSLENENDLYAIAQFYVNKYNDSALRKKISEITNRNAKASKPLRGLLNMGFSSIWTTNYDKLIEQGLAKLNINHNVIIRDSELSNVDMHERVNVYKLNGDIHDLENAIITKSDYESYKNKHRLFQTFLKKELISNTFLFVGYSFTDDAVISCLNDINQYLGKTGNCHYALMIVNNKTVLRDKYFAEDLYKRYGVKCIFIMKKDLQNIIGLLNARIREKKVFISGAYYSVPASVSEFADKLSDKLVVQLLNSGYRISTGVGKRLGTLITGYAHQYLAENKKVNPSYYLSMRPFPFHKKLSNATKIKYREMMQRDCSAAIFLFGQSKSTDEEGSFEATGHYSRGVYQEYTIAKKLGLIIIPVGITGYEAEVIWNEINVQPNKYFYLERYKTSLKTETNPQKLANLIVSILDHVARNRRIQQ